MIFCKVKISDLPPIGKDSQIFYLYFSICNFGYFQIGFEEGHLILPFET